MGTYIGTRLESMTNYIGAKLESKWRIGIVDRRENGHYLVKWTGNETGYTWENWWRQTWLDKVAAGKNPSWTLTMPKPDPQTQLREWIKNYD